MSDETIVTSNPENKHDETDEDLKILQEHLSPKYTVERKLGSGGMADVYLGFHNQLRRRIAIKVLPRSMSRDEGMVKRFLKEAESAAQLSHPNIINIYDIGVAGPLNFFIMAFISGGSLKDQLRTGTVSIERATDIIIQICGALQYAHSMGVIHRDIKPDNIMFDEHGNAILMDFGIAKAKFASKLTATGTLIGTPHYMSPEQLKGKELDGRSDTYSLGILFYEILTGKVPFEGDDTYAIGLKHIQEPPIPPLELNPGIPESLNNIILTMLAKTPEARFSCAQNVAKAVEDLRAGKEFDATKARTAVETWSGDQDRFSETVVEDDLSATIVRSDSIDDAPQPQDTVVSDHPTNFQTKKKNNSLIWILLSLIVISSVVAGLYFFTPIFKGESSSSDEERSSRRKKDKEKKEEVSANIFEDYELVFTLKEADKVLVRRLINGDDDPEKYFDDQPTIGQLTKDVTYAPLTDVFVIEQIDGSLVSVNSAGWDSSFIYYDESGVTEGPKMPSFADDSTRIAFTRIKDSKFQLLVSEISEIGVVGETYTLLENDEVILFPKFMPGTNSFVIYAEFSQEYYKTTFYMISPDDENPDMGFELEGELLQYDITSVNELFGCLVLDGNERSIVIVSEDTAEGESIYKNENIGHRVLFSSDGKYILFSQKDENDDSWDLYAIPVTGGKPEKITLLGYKSEINPIVWKAKFKEE